MMMLSMNRNMYTMNTPRYLFETMFVKHLESMSDENLLSTYPYYVSKFSLQHSPDNKDEEIIFEDEQFQNILDTNYDSFEKKPFDTEEEWIVIQNENACDYDFYVSQDYDNEDDEDDDDVDYNTIVAKRRVENTKE